MNKEMFLQEIEDHLKLPKEIRKDVIDEFKSHTDNFKDNSNMEKKMGKPTNLAKNVNKVRKVKLEEALLLPSTWIGIIKANALYFIFCVLSVGIYVGLEELLRSQYTNTNPFGAAEFLANSLKDMPYNQFMLIEKLFGASSLFAFFIVFLLGLGITIYVLCRQKLYRISKLQVLISIYSLTILSTLLLFSVLATFFQESTLFSRQFSLVTLIISGIIATLTISIVEEVITRKIDLKLAKGQ
jgi:hypothetical protein